jgi:demethylmenaquinone methyltransferase/2-methoxy-6-polyprenyl-1,4-benzoquinol methylase
METRKPSLVQPPERVRFRYNKLAPSYPLFEVLFLLPPGIRRRTVQRLDLNQGETVLEIGCGSGRNLPMLVKAVGPEGRVIGLELSEGMLARARQLCKVRSWSNVQLCTYFIARARKPISAEAVLRKD